MPKTFELHITCSKDIEELHINFADGSSIVKSVNTNKSEPVKKPNNSKYLPTDEEDSEINQEVITPPEVPDKHNDIKVAPELQELDI